MEGDTTTGALLLQDYNQLIDKLTKLAHAARYPSLFRMINIMLKKIMVYLNKALRCDAIIIATIMNPRCRT